METNMLEAVGLTKLEAKVYLALLELGSSTAGPIARKSGVHRRSVYDALNRLLEKGLATIIKVNNRHQYQVEDPQRLISLLKERQDYIEGILPELKLKFNMAQEKETTIFYKGKEGIKSIFEDQLRIGETVFVISGQKSAYEILPYYLKNYDRERVKKGMKVKILFSSKVKAPPLSEVRYISPAQGGHAAVNIYGKNVAIILWRKENPFGILIREEEIMKSYKDFFDLLWDNAGKR